MHDAWPNVFVYCLWRSAKLCFFWYENFVLLDLIGVLKIIVSEQIKICVEQLCKLQFGNNIGSEWKSHFAFKIAICQNQNSIFSQKCSFFKMKLAFIVENKVQAKLN